MNASIERLITVFPVPVTELSQMVATDINKIAMATILSTGMAISRNIKSVVKSDNNSLVKIITGKKISEVMPMLSFDIL